MIRIIHSAIFIVCFFAKVSGQMPGENYVPVTKALHQTNNKIIKPGSKVLSEDCFNNVDDNGNGLIDMKDYSCYFANTSPENCLPNKIVWACYPTALYWVDLETNVDRSIAFPSNESYYDITWTPDGKLYGCEIFSKTIREIDPNTGLSQFFANTPGYYVTNGMTTDAEGNLYLSSISDLNKWHVLKINRTTNQMTIVADLSVQNLSVAGDLTFFNGYIYVSCIDNKLGKVHVQTGSVQTIIYTGVGAPPGSFGITTIGDGFLYLCWGDGLYQLDPVTWVASLYYTVPTLINMYGLSSYAEYCNGPEFCRAIVNITTESTGPYCSNTGVLLKGAGTGITSGGVYTWTTAQGQTINTDTLRVFTSGRYYLRYHTMPDSCGNTDSIDINIIQSPEVLLPGETFLCTGSQLTLVPVTSGGITSYLWQDGSSGMQYTTSQPGLYWVEVSNVCGIARDSVNVIEELYPNVLLGTDTLLCPQTAIILRNSFPRQPNEIYTWSTGSDNDSLVVTQPGNYWLRSVTTCGTKADSITVVAKDSCICKPFFAEVDLGTDKEICNNETLTLVNRLHQPGYSYRWQNGSTASTFIVQQPGMYWADVTTYCNTTRDSIIVIEKTFNCTCDIYLPNAFTPNNDNKNEKYLPLSYCDFSGEIKIFNRWGNLVYTTNNLKQGWDGNYNHVKQPAGVYLYHLTFKFAGKPTNSQNGTLILIR